MTLRPRVLLVAAVAAASVVPVVAASPAAAAEPPRVWVRDLPGGITLESSPALADVDRDGSLDVLFGDHDGDLNVLDGRTGNDVRGWPQRLTQAVNSSPSLGDVDGDGQPEVFVGAGTSATTEGALYSFGLDGGLRYRRAMTDPDFPRGAPVHSTPAIGDIDGDGNRDVTVGGLMVRSLWSFRGVDGAPLSGDELVTWDDTIFSSAALADVDGDGRLDAVIGGDSTPGAVVDHRGGMVQAVDGNGRILWSHFIDDIVRGAPSIGDIDGDGELEVVHGAGDYWHGRDSTRVFALDARTGRVEWARDTDGITNGSPTLADVDGDGRLDVVFGTFDSLTPRRPAGSVYAVRGTDGTDLRNFPKPSGGGAVLAQITTADVNADGGQDLFVSTGAFISVLDGKSGARLYDLARGVGFQGSPAIADVDGNGRLDVLAAGGTKAFRWELPAGAVLGKLGWHQFRKDVRRTGSWTSDIPNADVIPMTRTAGADRFATAAALAPNETGGVVLVATGTAFADALAGGPTGEPVLLVNRDAIPAATRARLGELRPSEIVVLGGPAAVSDAVVEELRASAPRVTRVAGANRYGTAAAISARTFTSPPAVAYVATGANFPDALAGAAAGARQRGPVLLVDRDAVPPETAAELRRLQPRSIVILGGAGTVSGTVETQLRGFAAAVSRHAGPDRYATAVEVSEATFPTGAATAYLATGRTFPDALAGGPRAAAAGAPLLLVPGRCMPNVVRSELERLQVTSVVLLGGEGAVSGAVAALTPC